MKKYNPSQIEKKWQEYWVTNETFKAVEDSDKEKKFVLVEFPYPSGDGLHMGHLKSYTAADVLSRYYRMQGKEVMYPLGWDAFGLPAENYAIKHGVQPAVTTAKNISNIKKQCQALGYSFDWSREFSTTDPEYYKWTQWLFLQFYKAGLAYEATGMINWCPKDKTGLANEEVVNGECERCHTPVEKKELRQWYLKITEYAEKLLEGLKNLPEWPEAVKVQQKNWIGRKEGINIEYEIEDRKQTVTCFTTRPDTNFGATFVVIGPEHPLLQSQQILDIKDDIWKDIENYKSTALLKAEEDRSNLEKEKTGVFTGLYCVNSLNNYKMPLYVADYVLGNVGTGAVVGVPGHDLRDFEFAKAFGIEIVRVVQKDENDIAKITDPAQVQEHEGIMVNSDFLNGLDIHKATEVIMDHMEEKGWGKKVVNYKLRDWVFSRQRYWGEPIPMIHCDVDGIVPVPEDQLPVVLPEVEKYEPTGTGESPLAAIETWVNTTCPKCNGPAKRETNTMPQWAGSSWYYLRYADPKNDSEFASQDKLKYWLPVDTYFGGMEHTTLHLLYSRFWHQFLFDQGLVPTPEPYAKRVPHGIVLASDGTKMSKSKGNVVNPDELVNKHGADTTRMYELFLGPHKDSVSWSDQGIIGVARFLDKVWQWVSEFKPADSQDRNVDRAIHNLIKSISEDIESFSYNTAVSSFMKFYNEVKDLQLTMETMQSFIKLLYPFAPHISEELFAILGGEGSVQKTAWPIYDESKLVSDMFNVVVQVNGKVRDIMEFASGTNEKEIIDQALLNPKIISVVNGQTPTRTVYVAGRLLNIVI